MSFGAERWPRSYPQIPVDLIATVTSLAWRPFPVCASSAFGNALSNQRLWDESVYMPTFWAICRILFVVSNAILFQSLELGQLGLE